MKTHLTIILFSLLIIVGCKEVDKLTHFNIDLTETVVIPASIGIDLPFEIKTPDIETNSQATFEVNDTRKDMVEEVKLSKMDITLTNPVDGDFSFLKSITIYMSTATQPEVKVAWKENIPDTTKRVLNLDVSNVDLKEYIKEDKVSLRVNTVTDELLTTDHTMDILAVFFVDAKILGL